MSENASKNLFGRDSWTSDLFLPGAGLASICLGDEVRTSRDEIRTTSREIMYCSSTSSVGVLAHGMEPWMKDACGVQCRGSRIKALLDDYFSAEDVRASRELHTVTTRNRLHTTPPLSYVAYS
jgi:hypothetical protein